MTQSFNISQRLYFNQWESFLNLKNQKLCEEEAMAVIPANVVESLNDLENTTYLEEE